MRAFLENSPWPFERFLLKFLSQKNCRAPSGSARALRKSRPHRGDGVMKTIPVDLAAESQLRARGLEDSHTGIKVALLCRGEGCFTPLQEVDGELSDVLYKGVR